MRRLLRWQAPPHLGPTVLVAMTAVGVFGVVWGGLHPPQIQVVRFDAGNLDQFAIHRVVAYPERDLYLVGLESGAIRAIDGRVEGGCRVRWLPEDARGSARNPAGLPGVFEDPCTQALWSFEGNAISGTSRPLRTPQVEPGISADGRTSHVFVELVNPSP